MFHRISESMQNRMEYLEKKQAKERKILVFSPLFRLFSRLVRKDRAINLVGAVPGVSLSLRLRQISPETGRFLALLAVNAPSGNFLEIGTSAGYSAMWLTVACRQRNTKLVTFEILEAKAEMARETFRLAGVEDVVELVEGDAREYLHNYDNIAFCFLDAANEVYLDCYEAIIPKFVCGGLLVVDNILSHPEDVRPLLERAFNDKMVDALVVPIGSGVLVCRKT